jgi:hypothetical protein
MVLASPENVRGMVRDSGDSKGKRKGETGKRFETLLSGEREGRRK